MSAELLIPFRKDLNQISELQRIFDTDLGRQGPTRLVNYNPVLARWKSEQLKTDKEKRGFKIYETFQITTALRERHHAAKASLNYIFGDDGHLYNQLFPDETFETVLERGLAYRHSNGSKELVRESSEIEGWKKIRDRFSSDRTPIGTKAIVVSGPGIIDETSYKDNYVDIYELKIDSVGNKYIKMIRHASSLEYQDYYEKIIKMEPDYFSETYKPIDAWFLSHPIFVNSLIDKRTAEELFNGIFERPKEAMKEEDFEVLIKNCLPLINYYIEALCQPDYNPKKIALAWNAVLNKSDMAKDYIGNVSFLDDSFRKTEYSPLIPPSSQNIEQEVRLLGRLPVRAVAAGCGNSEGFETDIGTVRIRTIQEAFSNSIARYSLDSNGKGMTSSEGEDEYGPLTFNCPKRKDPVKPCVPGIITRPKHKLLPVCPHCGTNIRC